MADDASYSLIGATLVKKRAESVEPVRIDWENPPPQPRRYGTWY